MDKQLKKLIEPCILAGLVDADREELIKVAQSKLEDHSSSYVDRICAAADLQDLIDERSDIVKQELQIKLDEKLK